MEQSHEKSMISDNRENNRQRDNLKILFVVPPYNPGYYSVPEGTGIVATVTKNAGFDVQILLCEEQERPIAFHNRVVAEIQRQGINVVAIGGQSPSYRFIEQLIAMAKNAGAITVLGGYIVDSSPEVVAANIGADYCIYGEGEFSFLELMQALQSNTSISDVRGLVYMQDGELITTPPRDRIPDLDTLPFVDGDLCHYDCTLSREPYLTLYASRSCPFQCTFCYHLKGSRYRTKSLDYLFRELDYRLMQYGDKIKELRIQDEMFNVDKTRLLEFCRRIKEYKLPFWVQTRVDFIDEESIIALKDAGATLLAYGLESANNKVLASMKKQYTIEQAGKTLELTEKYGLKIQANLIIGDVEDDLDSVNESEAFFHKYAYKYDLNIALIRVFPGTQLFKHAISRGIIKDELEFIKNGCPLINVSKLPDEVYALLPDKYYAYTSARIMLTSRPLEKARAELSVGKNGVLELVSYCPLCYAKIIINMTIENSSERIGKCPQCSQRIVIKYARTFLNFDYVSVRNWIESYLQKYQDSRIVVWGVNDIIIRFIISSQLLRDMIVKIVDVNYQSFERETYCGLPVENPEILKHFQFDYIITPTIERRHEIIKSLDNMGITPHFIEFQNYLDN